MKCYVGGSSNPYEYPYVAVCFALNQNEAKKLMWNNSDHLAEECDHEWHDARITRQPDHDKFLDVEKTEPYIVRDDVVLRQMGWSHEGERQCDSCGLYAMGMDKFDVCNSCGQCPECGFDDECEEHEDQP